MQDGNALPIICEAESCIYAQRFAYLKILVNHRDLYDEEKILWLWLATTKANNLSFTCSINYRHISDALNVPSRFVHRALFRLKLMGFIKAAIPVYYWEPTPEMVEEVRMITLLLPPVPLIIYKDDNGPPWPLRGKSLIETEYTNMQITQVIQNQQPKKEAKKVKKLMRFCITIANFLNYRKRFWRLLNNSYKSRTSLY